MYTYIALLTRKPGTTPEAFKTYYENHHIPFVISVSGDTLPNLWKRRYIDRESPLMTAPDGTEPKIADFDVITELGFEDVAARDAWFGQIAKYADRIAEDEENFMDRGRTRVHPVEVFESKR